MIERNQDTFLKLYSFALGGGKLDLGSDLSEGNEWKKLLRLADIHRVSPMIYEAVFGSSAEASVDASLLKAFEQAAIKETLRQARMTAEFLKLYRYLSEKELYPAVMKGIICRSLYPHPEQRSSTDEDLLVSDCMFRKVHEAFLEYGLSVVGDPEDVRSSSEVSYFNKKIYIELHKRPFPPEEEAYGDLNRYFTDALSHTVIQTVYGVPVYTLGYTDHLLYLLCHTYKHFLNCGTGIRQVSDILLYSLKYYGEIDWVYVVRCCREADMFEFCCAIYRVGDTYLLPGRLPDDLRDCWLTTQVDEKPLLEDILNGGVYGTSTRDRLHSSNITLNAMGRLRGRNSTSVFGNPLLTTLFPPYRYMKQRYSYVRRMPLLLPIGWIQRILSYGYESIINKTDGNNASEALRIGNERVRLMEQYRIFGSEKERSGKGVYEKLKRVYKRSHKSRFAPMLSHIFMIICAAEYLWFNTKWFLQGNRKPSSKDIRLIRKNVTFIFKSFERQKMAEGLCRNISRMYPGVRIIVADDSKEPLRLELDNVSVIRLPFNSGLSLGLQAALDEVKTPYVVRLDDDELLTLRTKVHRELRYLHRHPELDIIGFGHMTAPLCRSPLVNFKDYYKQPMDFAPKPLIIPHLTRIDDNHIVLGKIANIYLARTDKLRSVGFDPNIRIIDHDDFFRRAAGNLVSAVALDTVVFHRHDPYDRVYNTFRSDYGKDKMYIKSMIRREKKTSKEEEKINE